jgi:hypothetical protein
MIHQHVLFSSKLLCIETINHTVFENLVALNNHGTDLC